MKAIKFDNSHEDYINFGTSVLNNLTRFTLECWVKFDIKKNVNLSGTLKSGGIIGQNNAVEIFIKEGKYLRFWAQYTKEINGDYNYVDIDLSKNSIGNDVWHHIAGVGDASTLRLYIDGRLVGTQSNSDNYLNGVTHYGNASEDTKLGGNVSTPMSQSPGDAAFNGLMAKAGIWNRALNADSIKILAENFHTYSASDKGLLAGYNFFEEKGDTIKGISTVLTAPNVPKGAFSTRSTTPTNIPVWQNIFPSWCVNLSGTRLTAYDNTNFITGLNGDSSPDANFNNYTVHIQGITCTEKTKPFLVDIDYTCPNLWEGKTSTDWAYKYNWSGKFVPFAEDEDPKRITAAKYTSIPVTAKNVEFATTMNNSGNEAVNNLILDKKRTVCGDFKNESNRSLEIPPAKSLTINGTATTNHVDRILIQANDTQYNGSLIFTRPDLNPAVKATVQMYTRGYKGTEPWTWHDPLGATYNGYYRWQYFGVPVNSADILYNNTSLWGSYIRKYEERENLNSYYQKWINKGNNDILIPFAGYEITQPAAKTISFQGNLVTGDQTLNLTKTETGAIGELNYGSGYNIFGNSFTAAIDIKQIQFPVSGVDKTVYLYNTGSLADWGGNDTKTNISDAGRYLSIPQETCAVTGEKIPSMQGFLLKTTTNDAKVTIPYSTANGISATPNTTRQKVKRAVGTSGDLSYMTIDVTGQSGADRVWLFSQPGTSHGFDNGWDGEKLSIADGVTLYVVEESGNYQVNTADDLEGTYLAFMAGQGTDYTLIINKKNLSGYETLYLTDLATGDEIDLSAVDSTDYVFTASNTDTFDKRFVLSRTSKIGTGTHVSDNSSLKVYSSGKIIRIQNGGNENGSVQVVEVTGKQLYTGTYQAYTTTEINTGLPAGAYLVKLKSATICQSQTVVILH